MDQVLEDPVALFAPPKPPTVEDVPEDVEDVEGALNKLHRIHQRKLRDWKKSQPLMTFRLRPGAGHHIQTDADGVERFYRASEGKAILSPLNLADQWPEKFERIDGYATEQNPYLAVPAPGELPEEFQRRMERLKAQSVVNSANAQARAVGIPLESVLNDPLLSAGIEVGVKPHPQSAHSAPHVTDLQAQSPLPVVNQKPQPTNLDKMSVAELKKYAEDNEVTLSPNLSDKAKIVMEIRRGMDRK